MIACHTGTEAESPSMMLFLQGDRQIGKSTILREALLPHAPQVAGLMVQRLFEGGEKCGYRACVVRGALPAVDGPYTPGMPGVFLCKGQARPGVLEKAMAEVQTVCADPAYKLLILDEIGGMEPLSGAFMRLLRAVLALGKPCVGVLKSRQNLAGMAGGRLGLPPDILALRDALQQSLEAQGRVLTVTQANRPETRQAVEGFVAGIFR